MKKELTDEELIFLMSKGDSHAEAIFYDRYYSKAKFSGHIYYLRYSYTGISEEEFASVAFSVTPISLKKYEKIKGNFYAYWAKCVKNEVFNYIASDTLISSKNNVISLDNNVYAENDRLTLNEKISSTDKEYDASLEDCIKNYIYDPKSNLSDDEALVAHFLYYREYSYEDIMKRTHWSRSKTFYVLRNTRKKISDYLKSTYFN